MGNPTEAAGDDLEVLEPGTQPVPYRGKVIAVGPIGIGLVPRLVRQARPLFQAIFELEQTSEIKPEVVLELIANHGDQVIEAVAIALELDPAFVAKGNPAEFTLLSMTVFEVNRDFFAPMLERLLAQMRPGT